MKIAELIKCLDNFEIYPNLRDFDVEGLSCNSKDIRDNFIFAAIKGSRNDGNAFIREAIKRGAKAVITQSDISDIDYHGKTFFLKVPDARKTLANLASSFYGNPSGKIRVVGITGTNGKTTVSFLIEAILKEANKNPAVIGTINNRFKNKVTQSKNTTPGPIELQSMLSDVSTQGGDYCLMEVSSHALDQNRTLGINFSSAIFTNLTQDHLDYHDTIENYFLAKLKLFKFLGKDSFAVINIDDAYGRRLIDIAPCRVIAYGIKKPADISAKRIEFGISHTRFVLNAGDLKIKLKTKLIGIHNVYNILAAVAWAINDGVDLPAIKSAVEKFNCVPGRLERINFEGDFSVFVDYAHTEDALANVIGALRQITAGRIIVLFGCGGERDKTKRPKMGRVVTDLADYAVITNDNPRSEDPAKIIDDIKKGIVKQNFCVIADRMEAITKSLSLAKKGDAVLIAGKGHEDYQILRDRILHFDDREAVRNAITFYKKCLK